MNERIRKLADEATEPPVFPATIGYFNREKFAELIVRECASKVTRNEALNILEHFGVEE